MLYLSRYYKGHNMAHKQDSATSKQFANFTQYITNLFLNDFGKSYMTQESVRNRWRAECDYSIEAEQFLILKSRTYLRMLDSRDSKSTDPHFLNALTNLMADYLSAYTMRAGGTRRRAKDKLKAALYTENPYIQNLLADQEQRRKEGHKRTPEVLAARRKHDTALAAKRARELHRQVMGEFAETSTYCKKR